MNMYVQLQKRRYPTVVINRVDFCPRKPEAVIKNNTRAPGGSIEKYHECGMFVSVHILQFTILPIECCHVCSGFLLSRLKVGSNNDDSQVLLLYNDTYSLVTTDHWHE